MRFANPIVPGCHPDPSICRVGDDFYLAVSSFEYFPGVPIFHSRDLVHWRQIGHVLTRKSQLDLTSTPSSGGIYAPTLRYARGRFYLITTNIDSYLNFFVTAKRPEGPWSDPIAVDRGGIDPSLTFDGDTVYYSRDGKGKDFNHPVIQQAVIDIETGKLASKPRTIWKGTGGIWPEGSHLLKHGDWYYLITAEGGTWYDHSIVVARSKHAFGPFVGDPSNPVLTHRNKLRSPIQAVGHTDLVQLPDGSWWAVMLGIRPKGGRTYHLGRETLLAPVRFDQDGWPRFGRRATLPLRHEAPRLPLHPFRAPKTRDDFDSDVLDCTWQFIRNPSSRDWSLKARPGYLRLMASASTLDEVKPQCAIVRRQQHFNVCCRAKIEFHPESENEEAGLLIRAREGYHYTLAVKLVNGRRCAVLTSTVDSKRTQIGCVSIRNQSVILEVNANASRYTMLVNDGGRKHPLGHLPTRPLSSEYISERGPMHFTGVMIGLYASGNGRRSRAPADFDWFEYLPTTQH
jgi:xylan 1,4-beta-xylosidase